MTHAVSLHSFLDSCEPTVCSSPVPSSIQIERSEAVDFIVTAVAMPNTQVINTGNRDHILSGQSNWSPWFLRFKLDAHGEGIWSLFDGSEEIFSKPGRPLRPARAGTDLTANIDASNIASSALASITPATTEDTSIDFSHQIFLYLTELEFFRMDLHDYERQHDRVLLARKMLYARIDRSMFALIHDDKDDSLSSEFAHLQSCYKPQASLAIQLTRRKSDQINLATCKDMSEYLNKMCQLRQELAYAGARMSDTLYIAALIDGLPAAYNRWRDRYYEITEGPGAPRMSLVPFEGRLIHWESSLTR
jgi:hypothetical protein